MGVPVHGTFREPSDRLPLGALFATDVLVHSTAAPQLRDAVWSNLARSSRRPRISTD